MFEEFKALAYRKAIWEKVGEVLRDHFPEDLDSRSGIVCDDVPYKDRKVPREAIEDVIEEVANIVREAEQNLSSFDMVRKGNEGRATGTKAQPARSSSKSPRRKARKS